MGNSAIQIKYYYYYYYYLYYYYYYYYYYYMLAKPEEGCQRRYQSAIATIFPY